VSTTLPQVDVNIPRFNQGWVALLTGLAFVLQWWPLVAVTAAIVAVTRFAGPGYGLFTQLYLRVVRPRLDGPVETEWAAPPRFSQLLAVTFLIAATVLLATGLTVAGWVVTLLVTALATLASAARICVGCIVYERMVQGARR
jgi:hypothetical protein